MCHRASVTWLKLKLTNSINTLLVKVLYITLKCELLLPGIGGSPGKIFNSCQTQGNSFVFYFSFPILNCNLSNSSLSLCEMGYAQKLSSKTGYVQLKGRAMPTIHIIWKDFSLCDSKISNEQ